MTQEDDGSQAEGSEAISTKMALAKERLGLEVKKLGDLIEREIVDAGEWPPPPEVSMDIRRRSMALGARTVKLLDAVDKLEDTRAKLEEENEDLARQIHDLRMKSTGISPAELAHLKMENEVLKEHVQQLEQSFSVEDDEDSTLQAENAKLAAKLKDLEKEVHALLGASSEAAEAKEENERLKAELAENARQLQEIKASLEDRDRGAGILVSLFEPGEEGEEEPEASRTAVLQERIKALEAENEQLMENARQKMETIKQERDDLATKVVELAESSVQRSEQAIEEIMELQKERDRLQEALARATSSGEAAGAAPSASDDPIVDSLRKSIGELEKELDEKDEEILELKRKIS